MRPILQDLLLLPHGPRQVVLAYWVRSSEEAALAHELHRLACSATSAGRAHVRLVLVTTRPAGPAAGGAPELGPLWERAQGRLDPALLSKVVLGPGAEGGQQCASLAGWHAFTCGPPGFLAVAEQSLQELGMDMAHAHTESFAF